MICELFDPITITRPPLRWHGGKFRLAKWILSFFVAHQNYVEVFGGAAGVLLRRKRARVEVYNVPRTECLWMNFQPPARDLQDA